MFFDSDTIANRNRLLFGKQGRAGISFLFRIIPILMIAGQLKVDLSFLQLCLLQAENIGICRLKVLLITFFHAGSQSIYVPGYHFFHTQFISFS